MSAQSQKRDEIFLRRALALAQKGIGFVNPNPLVGAVVVKQSRVIGEGYYHRFGGSHAEIEALCTVENNPHGSTLYVTLEPHCFYGHTPPCTDAIVKAGIKRVVCITSDPNSKVNGRGLRQLRKAGVAVELFPKLAREARQLNEAYFISQEKKRPFVALKYAASLDGKIATRTHDSKWITNLTARHHARKLRRVYQAILVGINTILKDNPHLGTRSRGQPDPWRIILDSKLKIPLHSKVLRDSHCIIAISKQASKRKKIILQKNGITILTFSTKHIPLPKLLHQLYKKDITSILVEGGGETHGNFIDQNLIDKYYIYLAPLIIGGREAVSAVAGIGPQKITEAVHLRNTKVKQLGNNWLITGYPKRVDKTRGVV